MLTAACGTTIAQILISAEQTEQKCKNCYGRFSVMQQTQNQTKKSEYTEHNMLTEVGGN